MKMSSSDPFFSVITCTKNVGRHLKENIDSVKNQDFNNYEHLFVDGYSTDNTEALIKKYMKKGSRVRLVSRKPEGISRAMNEGIRVSRGRYLIHLHGDDRLSDDQTLMRLHNFLISSPRLDWLYGKIKVIEKDERIIGSFPENRLLQLGSQNCLTYQLLKFYNFIPHQAVVIKRKVFQRFDMFDESLSSKMDYDLWLRIAKNTNWSFFDSYISNFMIRAGAQSSSIDKKKENWKNLNTVQKRYLNIVELCFARLMNKALYFFARNTR